MKSHRLFFRFSKKTTSNVRKADSVQLFVLKVASRVWPHGRPISVQRSSSFYQQWKGAGNSYELTSPLLTPPVVPEVLGYCVKRFRTVVGLTNPLQVALKNSLSLGPPVVRSIVAALGPTEWLENLFHRLGGQREFTPITSFLWAFTCLLWRFPTLTMASLFNPSYNCLNDMELANTNNGTAPYCNLE